ncbi:rRNA adenine N-6-methyltransferase family protein [Sphingomonas oligophenolica]
MISRALNGVTDALMFIRAGLAKPRQVGALLPSGAALARLITSEIRPSGGGVIEFGPGTGVFTRALIDRGIREEDLTLVEASEHFAPILRRCFPAARLLQCDAARLTASDLLSVQPVCAVVSGLPLLNMPFRKVFAIVATAFGHLGAGGALYQFTYGRRCPIPRPILDRLGLKAVPIGRAVRNVPPATVYRISRRAPLRAGMRGS